MKRLVGFFVVGLLLFLASPGWSGGMDWDASTLDINSATTEQLASVPGMNAELAQAIVTFRDTNGPFSSVDELAKVKGMDAAVLEAVGKYLTVPQEEAASEMQ